MRKIRATAAEPPTRPPVCTEEREGRAQAGSCRGHGTTTGSGEGSPPGPLPAAVRRPALIVLVFQLTGSGLGVSGVVIAEILPVLLLAPIAGAVVDRLPRVRVMVAADLARTALAAGLPLVDQHLAAVYAAGFGMSAGAVFFNPAAASVLPAIVEDDELLAANSGLWSAAVVSQIALAPLAGAVVAAWGGAVQRSGSTRPPSPSPRSP